MFPRAISCGRKTPCNWGIGASAWISVGVLIFMATPLRAEEPRVRAVWKQVQVDARLYNSPCWAAKFALDSIFQDNIPADPGRVGIRNKKSARCDRPKDAIPFKASWEALVLADGAAKATEAVWKRSQIPRLTFSSTKRAECEAVAGVLRQIRQEMGPKGLRVVRDYMVCAAPSGVIEFEFDYLEPVP